VKNDQSWFETLKLSSILQKMPKKWVNISKKQVLVSYVIHKRTDEKIKTQYIVDLYGWDHRNNRYLLLLSIISMDETCINFLSTLWPIALENEPFLTLLSAFSRIFYQELRPC
jgi:hypothetical protein